MNWFSPRSVSKAIQLLAGIFAVLLLCLPAFPQGSSGRIVGTVTDTSGGVLSGATVTVVDTDRGVSRTLTTDDAGEYNAPNLTPGNYTVRAEAKGFKKLERQNVVLEVGKELRIDVVVQPGVQEQTVTVTEAVPLVETTNATLGGTLNHEDIADMPLNGRNYQNLLALRPGVMIQPGGGPWTQSTNNVRPDESVWLLDGVINSNFYDSRSIANMSSPFTDGATILPIDAIQEFNLEENPKAEYGWKPGAVVNVGLRAGTNTLHGSAYGFYRSAAWDARDLFNPAPVNGVCSGGVPNACDSTPLQLKQFGGVLGGPIKKDKLFFFSGFEGLRSLVGNSIGTTGVPETISQANVGNFGAAGDVQSSMIDAIRALQLAGTPISQVSMKLACPNLAAKVLANTPVTTTDVCVPPSDLSYPNNPSHGTGFNSHFPNTNNSNNGITKIDYHINDKNTLNGLLLISDYTGDGEDHPLLAKSFLDTWYARTYTTGANWVWAPSSRVVNEARFGYNHVVAPFTTDDGNIKPDGTGTGCAAINTGVTSVGGCPIINVLSGSAIGDFQTLGTWHNRPSGWTNYYEDFQDSVSYLKGKHTFKFGVEFAHNNVGSTQKDNIRGRIDFAGACGSGLESLFCGSPSKKSRIFTGSADRTLLWDSTAAFAQDDWRISPKLTLNLGLRYSYSQPIKEANNLWGNFLGDPTNPSAAIGLVQQGQSGVGPTIWKPDRKNFSPRLGFAYDVTGKGTTVVRGGFSIIYSTFIAAEWLSQAGLQNTGGTTLTADPTGACTKYVPPDGVSTCTSVGGTTYGGTMTTLTQQILPASLCWDPASGICGAVAKSTGQTTVFPTGVVASCSATRSCSLMAVDPNLKVPYVENWSVGVQHAFGPNLSLDLGYVGTHGARLTGFRDLNQGDSTGALPFATKFPGFHFINQMSNQARSNYDSLQATVTKRTSHGLSFTAGYTYGHGLDNGSLNRAGYLPQDSTHPEREYASSDFDVRHRLTVTASYEIPGIKGFAQMLEGWKLNTIVSLQSAQPWDVSESSPEDPFNFSQSGETADRWNFTGNPADFGSGANTIPYCNGPGGNGPTDVAGGCSQSSGVTNSPTIFSATDSAAMWAKCTADAADPTTLGLGPGSAGCFVKGSSVLTPPANGKFGNLGRNSFRDSGFRNVDFSVFKTFTYKERYSAQFRLEMFNLFNHPIIANPYGSVNGWGVGNDPSLPATFGCGCATSDVAAGNPGVGSGGARSIQVGLKLLF